MTDIFLIWRVICVYYCRHLVNNLENYVDMNIPTILIWKQTKKNANAQNSIWMKYYTIKTSKHYFWKAKNGTSKIPVCVCVCKCMCVYSTHSDFWIEFESMEEISIHLNWIIKHWNKWCYNAWFNVMLSKSLMILLS